MKLIIGGGPDKGGAILEALDINGIVSLYREYVDRGIVQREQPLDLPELCENCRGKVAAVVVKHALGVG